MKNLIEDKKLYIEIFKIKRDMISDTWKICKKKMLRSVAFRANRGISFGGREHKMVGNRFNSCSDEQLIEEFGVAEHKEPQVYGGIDLMEEEKKIIKLPPKFAIYEPVVIKDLDLEIRKGGVKGRWHHRDKEQHTDEEGVFTPPSIEELRRGVEEIHPYLKGGGEVDFTKVRATGLKYNRRYHIPKPINNGTFEINYKRFEIAALGVAKEVKEQLDNKYGGSKIYNLGHDEQKGLKMLVQRRKAGEVVVFETDKSSNLTVDESSNYDNKMAPHLNGEEVEMEQIESIEKEMNVRALVWKRIMRLGQKWGSDERVGEALTSTSTKPPVIYGLIKDHKLVPNGEDPPVRPVCGANVGPSAKHSAQMAEIIEPFNDNIADECWISSTEELLACIKEFNDEGFEEDLELFSNDAKALFPSILIALTVIAVRQIIIESDLEVKELDRVELSRFLAYCLDFEEQNQLGIVSLIMQRAHPNAKKLKVTGRELMNAWNEENSVLIKAEKDPDDIELRKMFAIAVSEEVRYIMSNHSYGYRDKTLIQTEGGSIGSILTCVVAKTRMIMNVRKLKQKLTSLRNRWIMEQEDTLRSGKIIIRQNVQVRDIKLRLFKVYVDDEFIVSTAIGPGWRYDKDNKRMLWTKEFELEDVNVPSDLLTARVITDISNDLDIDIKMTLDCPSNNIDGRMPVLDLKAWMTKVNGKCCIKTSFYKKAVSSKLVIKKDSALPWICKKSSLSGEVFRRLYNCSEDIRALEGPQLIREFCNDLMNSGYCKLERDVIITEGISRLNNLIEKVGNGERPLYRNGHWKKYDRSLDKMLKKRSWFGINTESVVFVQATPGEVLKKAVQSQADLCGLKIRVVEKGGRNIKSILQRSDVQPSTKCYKDNCVVCLTSDRGKCDVENAGYSVKCVKCEEDGIEVVMHGETGRCARVRCKEHYRDYQSGLPRSNLYQHVVDTHGGDKNTQFKFEVVGVFQKDVLGRQLEEGLRIENQKGVSMNSQNEWQAPAVIKVGAYRMNRH